MSTQYLRKYRLLVGTSARHALDVSNLRCVFYVEKAMAEEPGFSQITIYNMAPGSMRNLRKGNKVILEAGYQVGNYGMIFSGTVAQPLIRKEDTINTALTLLCQDGDAFLNARFASGTVAGGNTARSVVQKIIGDARGDVTEGDISPSLSKNALPRAKVLFGPAAGYLGQISRGNDAQFYIEDGRANMPRAADNNDKLAFELNPLTGLIGAPTQTEDGVSGRCLINPGIKLNTKIYINSKLVELMAIEKTDWGATEAIPPNRDGVYRIVRLVYEGDTHGDPWYVNFDAVTQTGTRPNFAKKNGNMWR